LLSGIRDLPLFVAAGLLLNATPGADTLYILRRSATDGWRGGALAALGISAGCCVHVAAAALGLSALLIASQAAFTAVRIAGALYLLYLGWSLLRPAAGLRAPSGALPRSTDSAVFLQGFLTNVLNPKVALFFLAFLPQFIVVGPQQTGPAILVLGAIFIFNGTWWNLLVAAVGAKVSSRFGRSAAVRTWLSRATGALFIYFGIRLSLSAR
jgi:threonine/homoserine/homoserine lactone efflux protein